MNSVASKITSFVSAMRRADLKIPLSSSSLSSLWYAKSCRRNSVDDGLNSSSNFTTTLTTTELREDDDDEETKSDVKSGDETFDPALNDVDWKKGMKKAYVPSSFYTHVLRSRETEEIVEDSDTDPLSKEKSSSNIGNRYLTAISSSPRASFSFPSKTQAASEKIKPIFPPPGQMGFVPPITGFTSPVIGLSPHTTITSSVTPKKFGSSLFNSFSTISKDRAKNNSVDDDKGERGRSVAHVVAPVLNMLLGDEDPDERDLLAGISQMIAVLTEKVEKLR